MAGKSGPKMSRPAAVSGDGGATRTSGTGSARCSDRRGGLGFAICALRSRRIGQLTSGAGVCSVLRESLAAGCCASGVQAQATQAGASCAGGSGARWRGAKTRRRGRGGGAGLFQGKDEGVRHKLDSRVEVASRAEVGRWRSNQKRKKRWAGGGKK